MKVKLSEWADKEFSKRSKPARATLIRWADSGKIPGAVFEFGHWWVDDAVADLQAQAKRAVSDLPEKLQGVF